ncbi:MAG: DNA-binding response regulator [Bacteroidetes bacterium]|jgi:two-component system response regulator HydG|nr:DNA-binding response regulator [Bacteroidota bacterium]
MNKKILIIDDEADIRFLLKRALSSHNYTVSEAENLKKGLDVFNQTKPDIVVLDVNLPDGSGTYYARKFKNENNIVIFISADHDKLADSFREAGADGFLKKPFIIDQLLEVITRLHTNTTSTLN